MYIFFTFSSSFGKKLLTRTVLVNNFLMTETVPVNNFLMPGTIPVNNVLLTGTVLVNNSLLTITLKNSNFKTFPQPPLVCLPNKKTHLYLEHVQTSSVPDFRGERGSEWGWTKYLKFKNNQGGGHFYKSGISIRKIPKVILF